MFASFMRKQGSLELCLLSFWEHYGLICMWTPLYNGANSGNVTHIYTIHFLFGEISDTETHITSVHLTHTHTLPLFAFTHCSQVFNEKIYPGWLRFRYVKIHAAGSFMDFNSLFSARVFTRYFPATRWSPAFSTFKKLGALTAWA